MARGTAVTWFKVDDGLHSHSKVDDATVAAMGLWVIAGSWASHQLTDGWVPRSRAAKIDPEHWRERSDLLVAAGFWHSEPGCPCLPDSSPLHEGKDGWHFHDWKDQQPSRQSVLDERRKQAERVAAWREKRRTGRTASTGTTGSAVGNGATESATAGVTQPATNAAQNGVRTHAPTRPDPTAPTGQGRVGRGSREGDGDKPLDYEGIQRRAAERSRGEPVDTSVRDAAVQQMRSQLPPGRSLSRWPNRNGHVEDR